MPFAFGPQRCLLRNFGVPQLPQDHSREALLEYLDHRPGISPLRLADQQMDVLRHGHISNHHKAVAPPNLFQSAEQQISSTSRAE